MMSDKTDSSDELVDPFLGRKLRIGIISPYSFETVGGVQLHIRDFAQQLISRGHHVEVLAPGRRTFDMPKWVQTTGSSFSIPYNGSVAHLSYFGLAGHKTRQWVKQGHFDILHLHEPEVPSISHKPLIPGFAPCPFVATFHAAFDSYPIALKAVEPYLKRHLSSISHAICVSESARAAADHYLPARTEQRIIPNGVDTSIFAQAQPIKAWQGTDRQPTIGFLGRLNEERKGFEIFAKAACDVLETMPGARFLCAGDGQKDAIRILRSFSPDLEHHFEFLGRISDSAKASLYKSLDVYVAPQTGGESFGIVLVEAMAAGCPIVASDLPAFRAISQDGNSILHFTNGDSCSCAKTIEAVFCDAQIRQSLSQAGVERSKCFDWQSVTEQVLSVYSQAIADYPPTM